MRNKEQINSSENHGELSDLRDSLRQAIRDGDLDRAGALREEILPQLAAMKEKIIMSGEIAREIMGDDYLGPEEVEKAFDIKISGKDVPKIPFLKEELEMAKRNGQFLILRVNRYKKKRGLVPEQMNLRNMRNIFNYKDIDIITAVQSDTVPRAGWALVKDEESFAHRDYLRETEDLAQFIGFKVDEGLIKRPEQYIKAQLELESKKAYLETEMRKAKPDARAITSLRVNQIARQSISEAVYDACVYYKNKGKLFFGEDHQIRTNTVSPLGGIMEVHIGKGSFTDGKLNLFVGAEECSYFGVGTQKQPAFVFARRG